MLVTNMDQCLLLKIEWEISRLAAILINTLVLIKATKEEYIVFMPLSLLFMRMQEFTKVRMKLVITIENYGNFGGAIYIKNCVEIELDSITIESNLAFQGGSYFFDYDD